MMKQAMPCRGLRGRSPLRRRSRHAAPHYQEGRASIGGVGMKISLAMGTALFLSACTGQWQSPGTWGANSAPVISSCPPELVEQASWVRNNLTRVPLGGNRQQIAQILGLPLQVESFLLADGSPVDILFYPTPEGACAVKPYGVDRGVVSGQSGLVPLVFQHDRLMGYGQGYYQQAVVPNLRTTLQYPAARAVPYVTPAGVGRGTPLGR